MNRKYPRAQWHDYNCGLYFITVVTRLMVNYLGEIHDDKVYLSEIGAVLSKTLEECNLHYKDIQIECFIVMPNHFHAIIKINQPKLIDEPEAGRPRHAATLPGECIRHNQDIGCLRPQMHPDDLDDFYSRSHHNARLSAVIGGIKAAVSRYANNHGRKFAWQANFHDHIIRNRIEYNLISEYIETNPQRWNKDKFNYFREDAT